MNFKAGGFPTRKTHGFVIKPDRQGWTSRAANGRRHITITLAVTGPAGIYKQTPRVGQPGLTTTILAISSTCIHL